MPTVQIVEDDSLISLHLSEALLHEGYTVSGSFDSGEEFLKEFKKGPVPEVVLMDIMLAGRIDGIETARRMKKIANVPVVFLTALNARQRMAGDRMEAMYHFLEKPVDHESLVRTLEAALPAKRRVRVSR